jgi:4-amino-4-deoxy-L-arabinose transferase-like glycosyltransferase
MIRKLYKHFVFLFHNDRKTYLALILIALLAFAIRFAYQQLYPAELQNINMDYYGNIAESLFHGEGYTIDGHFSALRGPGYPLFLFFIYKIFGINIFVSLLMQCLLEVGTTILIFFIGKKLYGLNFLALLASFLYAFFLPQVSVLTVLASEYFFTFLITLSFLAYLNTRKSKIWNFIFGICIGLVAITRPEGIFFFYMIIITNIILKKFKPLLFQSMGFLLILTPWLVYSSIQLGEFNKMNQLAGYNLINRNYVLANEGFFDVTKKQDDYKEFITDAFMKRELDYNKYSGIWGNIELYDNIGKEEFIELVKKRPAKFIYLMFAKFIHHSMGVQLISDPFRLDRENLIFQFPLVIILIIGFWKMLKSKNEAILFMVLFLITMFGIHTLSNPQPRGMVSLIPTLIILDIWFLVNYNKLWGNNNGTN